jgi:hypothetical protein
VLCANESYTYNKGVSLTERLAAARLYVQSETSFINTKINQRK